MKLTVNTLAFLNSVAIANQYVAKDGDYAGKINLSGVDGEIIVKASNLEQTIIFHKNPFTCDDLTVNSFNAITLDAKKLQTALKAAKTDEITIVLSDSKITIVSGRSRYTIEIVADVQVIEIANDGTVLNINDVLINSIKKVSHAVDGSNPKFELNGALLQLKDGKFNIVGTDTRRLALCSVDSNESSANYDIIIPKIAIASIIKLFEGFEISAKFTDTELVIHTETLSYSTKLINGKFPDYERIIPSSYQQTLTISRTKFTELLKEASLFSDEISIDINNGNILLKDHDGNTEIEDTCNEENVAINFHINAKNVLDFLGAYNGENINICFNSNQLPIVFTTDSEFQEVCMPIIVHNETENTEREAA